MSDLRVNIMAYLSEPPTSQFDDNWHCTWWFKRHMPFTTKVIRAELDKMKNAGLVESDHRESNNTKWRLLATPVQGEVNE